MIKKYIEMYIYITCYQCFMKLVGIVKLWETLISILGLSAETCLVPKTDDINTLTLSEDYNFISEMFYLTHQALALGFHVVQVI